MGTNVRLTSAAAAYFEDLRGVRASGGATAERSRYTALANLLAAVGAGLKPKVHCIGELADQGAGHPDFGLYAAGQLRRGDPREGQLQGRARVRDQRVQLGYQPAPRPADRLAPPFLRAPLPAACNWMIVLSRESASRWSAASWSGSTPWSRRASWRRGVMGLRLAAPGRTSGRARGDPAGIRGRIRSLYNREHGRTTGLASH